MQGSAAGFTLAPTDELLSVEKSSFWTCVKHVKLMRKLKRYFKPIQLPLDWTSMRWVSGCVNKIDHDHPSNDDQDDCPYEW